MSNPAQPCGDWNAVQIACDAIKDVESRARSWKTRSQQCLCDINMKTRQKASDTLAAILPQDVNVRSQELQNESSPNFSTFHPKMFCSEFSPNLLTAFRASFRGKRRQEKIHQKSPAFFNAKFPGNFEEKIHKHFLESGPSKILRDMGGISPWAAKVSLDLRCNTPILKSAAQSPCDTENKT